MDGQQSPTMKDKYFSLQQLMNAKQQFQHDVYYVDSGNHHLNDKKINQVKDNRVFLILGTITSGKTMVQYFLCQDQLVHGIEESKKLPYIVPENVYKKATIQKTPSTITSRIPNIRFVQIQEQIQDNKILFIQAPDIKQLKAQQQSIQYLFLQRLFKQCRRLHLLLVIEQTALCDVGQMMESFECITGLFDIKQEEVRQKISECMSIVVNKVSEGSEDSDVKVSLEETNDQVLAQQSQELSKIMQTVLKQDRVYIIKNTQPNKNQQKQFLQILLKYSSFNNFSQHQLSTNYLNQINFNQSLVQSFVQKLQLKKLWQANIDKLHKFILYLTDPKVLNQHSQQNILLVQQVTSLFQNEWQQQQLKQLIPQLKSIKIVQSGIKVNQNILLPIQSLIKTLQNLQTQQQSSLYLQCRQIIELLTQIKVNIRQQILLCVNPIKNNQQIYLLIPQNLKLVEDYVNSSLPLKLLHNLVSHIQTILHYITNVLNFDPQSSQHEQKQFTYNILSQLVKQLLQSFKHTFINFDLALLTINKRSKSPKKSKKVVIKKPNFTISQLRQQFMNQIKSKKNHNLIDQIIGLPVSHFKLYLLIQQFKQLQPKIDKDQQFITITILIKQIASILHFYQFFIDEIKFLLVIPDWNRISITVDALSKYQRLKKFNYLDQQQIQFLNKLTVYTKQKRLTKLSLKLSSILDQFLENHKMILSNINTDDYINQNNHLQIINQNWLQPYLQQLYKYPSQPNRSFISMIQKTKKYEQQNQQKINTFNQQMFLMKQTFN